MSLKNVLKNKMINCSAIAQSVGIGQSAVSQYKSDKATLSRATKKQIADRLKELGVFINNNVKKWQEMDQEQVTKKKERSGRRIGPSTGY